VKGKQVALIKTRQLIAVGAFAAAAAAGTAFAATTTDAPRDIQAYPGECLAWFGNQEDGKCLSYSNGQPVNIGTPEFGFYGPDGAGISTGPMIPGTQINQGIN
jgi:hypothetical protein